MELPKATDLFRQSWQMFKQKIKILILIQLVPFFAAIPILIVMEAMGLLEERPALSAIDGASLIMALLMLFFITVGLMLQFWAQAAMILAIDSPVGTFSFKDVFRRSRPLIWPYAWVSALTFFIIFLGIVALIIPGIIFALRYWMGSYTVLLEGKRGMEALRTSKSYAQGNLGKILTKGAFLFLIAAAVFMVPGGILDAVHLKPLSDIYTTLASLVFSPVAAIYGYLLYRGLRDMKSSQQTIAPVPAPAA